MRLLFLEYMGVDFVQKDETHNHIFERFVILSMQLLIWKLYSRLGL